MPRLRVIISIFKRNFASYFSGVLGYLFILAFVVVGAALAFNARFFTENEPNLSQLTSQFPLLLLFLVPAITMNIWAEEKKMGTDELLFTLPATVHEILFGKYFAVLAVYTVALLFSTPYILVLMYLGNPDWGLLFTTYLGYWVAGAAMLSAGMLASSLTKNMTVAFVLGVIICVIPLFIEYCAAFFGVQEYFQQFGLQEQFRDFGMGIIPLKAILYFFALTVVMLYLNVVSIQQRNWPTNDKIGTGAHFGLRAISIAVILGCLTAWAGYFALRVDATNEQLFSLSSSTRETLKELDNEKPIEIQAFISPDVPREYVDTKKQLVGLLRQFDEMGGSKLNVRYVDVEPFSEEEEEAEKFGIQSFPVMTEKDGRRSNTDVFLGAVFLSSYDKVVVPFFGKGLPIEYELTRSVKTVSKDERLTLGILQTDAGISGGGREWQIVNELKKQFKIENISPAAKIDPEKFNVLLAVLPSSLTQPEMANLVEYVKAGHPALIFDDPFPISFSNGQGITNAPRQPKPSPNRGGMFGGGSPPPTPKADGGRATSLVDALDIRWKYDRICFDVHNPHPEFGSLSSEYVFVTQQQDSDGFNKEEPITKDLQELLVLYSGTIQPNESGIDTEFIPLITTGAKSGLLDWEDFVDENSGFNMMTMSMATRPKPDREIQRGGKMDDKLHAIGARIKSDDAGNKINAIYVADVDMISDFFFQERNLGNLGIKFDNVSFVLNAVDALADDETFVSLRSRRAKHRTLTRFEAQKRGFLEQANEKEEKANEDAEKMLEQRQEKLKERVKAIEEDDSIDPIAKRQMMASAQQAEQQRFNLAKLQIDQNKEKDLQKIRNQTNRQIKSLEDFTRAWAIIIPAIPALLVGLFVFIFKLSEEKKNAGMRKR